MSANSTDLRLAAQEKLGGSYLLTVDTTARQLADSHGALLPGKYLIQALDLGVNRCWVKTSKWVPAASPDITLPALPAAGASTLEQAFPMDAVGITSFELHVRKGRNDRIQAIMSAGTALLVVTKTGD